MDQTSLLLYQDNPFTLSSRRLSPTEPFLIHTSKQKYLSWFIVAADLRGVDLPHCGEKNDISTHLFNIVLSIKNVIFSFIVDCEAGSGFFFLCSLTLLLSSRSGPVSPGCWAGGRGRFPLQFPAVEWCGKTYGTEQTRKEAAVRLLFN